MAKKVVLQQYLGAQIFIMRQ